MSVEYEFSGDEYQTAMDSCEIKRNMLYRFEEDGILVYDSIARISDEPIISNSRLDIEKKGKIKKPKLTAADYDSYQFQNIPAYGPVKLYPQDYTLVIPKRTLRFSSKFESGNLRKAIKVHEGEYRLLLEHDTETLGYTQWYYFSVTPYKPNHKVRFNITNLLKYESLYNEGMQPLTFSIKSPLVYQRKCTEICYFKNNRKRMDDTKFYYTLTFSYTFEDTDTIFFAYSYPYTHSDLLNYLSSLQARNPSILRCNTLCTTLAGNSCPVLTITSNINSYTSWAEELLKLNRSSAGRKILRIRESRALELPKKKHMKKKGVFITARVHPGESNSSYMAKGLIDFLVSDSKEAGMLRKKFVFKIIPMLNPDGVVYGNYRCSLLGVDLNRRWDAPNKTLHPTVYYAKRLLTVLAEEHEVLMYCDMHGHSMKKDVFMYGCYNNSRDIADMKANVFSRVVPFLLGQKNNNFSFKSSKFRIEKNKSSTARVVCYKELKILLSYTIEASFYGCSGFSNKSEHLSTSQLETLGKDLCSILLTFLFPRELRKKLSELTAVLSGKITEPKTISATKLNEQISIKDTIKDMDEEIVMSLNIEESEDSGGSDLEGSDNDEKKFKFKRTYGVSQKAPKVHEKMKSISPNDFSIEPSPIFTPKPLRLQRELLPVKKIKVRPERSASVIKDKIKSPIDERVYDLNENMLKLKSILHPSAIKFNRDRIPHDSSLNTISKSNCNRKQQKKSNLFEKKTKLQVIDLIKTKLNAFL